jgi:DNA-binding NarL/FixJ family response regulator
MTTSSAAFARRVRTVAAAIDEIDGGPAERPEAPIAAIAQLLGLDSAVSYSLGLVEGRPRVDTGSGVGVDAFVDRLDGFLARTPANFGSYDPVRPEASQRNRALRLHQLGPAAHSAVAKTWSLTPRQAEVLALVVQGEANKTIAATLRCSVRTVEVHLTALFEKAQCDSRSELGARFWQTRA